MHEVFGLVMANQANLPVRTMCLVLGVSASGVYAWRDRAPSQRSIANAVRTERIRQIQQDSYDSYGTPRVRAELIEQGVCISRQRVARLMRQAVINDISKRRGFTTRRWSSANPRASSTTATRAAQYTSLAFGERCRQMQVRPSMGTVGDAYDNAMAESFFASLEGELIERSTFQSKA